MCDEVENDIYMMNIVQLIEQTETLHNHKSNISIIPNIYPQKLKPKRTISSSDSSFSSSFLASSFGASAAGAAPPAAGAPEPAAGAPPPEPTFDSSSFTFFPSRALARSVAQIGSSSTLAPFVSARILSDC